MSPSVKRFFEGWEAWSCTKFSHDTLSLKLAEDQPHYIRFPGLYWMFNAYLELELLGRSAVRERDICCIKVVSYRILGHLLLTFMLLRLNR